MTRQERAYQDALIQFAQSKITFEELQRLDPMRTAISKVAVKIADRRMREIEQRNKDLSYRRRIL